MATTQAEKERSKRWYEKNRGKRLVQIRKYQKENPEITYRSFKKYYIKYQRERRKTDTRFNLDQNLLRAIRKALKISHNPKENIWLKKLGYKMSDLKKHLQNRIPEGYAWQDYIDCKIELDHVIPRYLFIYQSKNDPEFKKCWAIKNLRLLPRNKNKLNYFTGFRNERKFQKV